MQNTDNISLNLPINIDASPMPKFDFGYGLIIVFCLVDAVFILSKIFEWLSPKEVSLISDSNQLASSCLAVLMTLQVVRHPALGAETRRSWKILTLAYFTYGIGNLFWFYYSSMLNEKPFPTMADAGYWGFYPLMFWALLSFPTIKINRSEQMKFLMDIAIVMLGGITAVWHFIIQPILANLTEGGLLPVFLNLSYTVGDLVLMLGIATILLRQVSENSRKTLYIIILGLISMSIADYGFAYLTLQNTYYSGHWIDTFFQTSSLAFAIGSHYQYKQLCKPIEDQAAETNTKTVQSFSWLPYLAVALGCAMLLVETQPYWNQPLGLIVFASLGITALVVIRQITAVKENVRLHTQNAITQSELKFKTLVENSSDILTIRDISGKVIFRSSSVKNILGFEIEEMDQFSALELIHPDDIEELSKSFNRLEAGETESFKTEYRHKHKDGSWRVMEGIAKKVDDELSGLQGFIVNSRDITSRKKDEEKLRLYNTKLEQSNRELQDFAYVASHDLQEPLRKVQAFGDRLDKKYAEILPDEGRDYISRMRNAAERMQRLINDLLTFSRVATKAQPFELVNIKKITEEVISDLEVRLEETKGTIEIGELPQIDADPIQMRQLIQNLIGNALKFHHPDQSPNIKIYTEEFSHNSASFSLDGNIIETTGSTDKFCQIMVQDNGIGFDEKYLDRIFTVFQRLHGRTEYEGSGVGLAVCRKIVERHGGSITAQSKEGQGATFMITLPLKQTQEEILN